jgi:hypothetical protein
MLQKLVMNYREKVELKDKKDLHRKMIIIISSNAGENIL